jgi:hypothetical protein
MVGGGSPLLALVPSRWVPSVKGSAITSRIRYVRDRFGESALRRLKQNVSDVHRAQLEGKVLPHAWAPYDLFVEMNVQIDKLFGNGDLALCREMGRYSAEVNLPTLYRIFYKLGTPMFIFGKAARLWQVHYDSGQLVPVQESKDRVRLKIEGFAEPHRAHCLSVLGWAEQSIEISGAEVVDGKEDKCRTRGDEACELILEWK